MRWSIFVLVLLSGCASVQRPLSAKRAAAVGSPEAVVNHLSQTAASGELCDARLGTPLLANESTQRAVVETFAEGAISEAVFERCTTLALETLPAVHATAMIDRLVLLYEALLSDETLERDHSKHGRLSVVHRRLLERPTQVMPTQGLVEPRLARLRTLLPELGPVRRAFAEEVLQTAELEAGRWKGAPVDLGVFDALLASKDERTLLRAARRLPEERLRIEAAKRLVRLRLSTSRWSHLDARTVEATVLRYGANPIDVPRADIEEAHLERDALWGSTVAVLQPRGASFHELRAPGDAVLPTMHLRNVVWVKVKGLEHAITVCESGRPLDPTPCLPEASVSIESPVVTALGEARYDFHDDVPLALSLDLAGADHLRLPVHLDGEVMGWIEWKLRYLTGDAIEFVGAHVAQPGPALAVRAREHLLSRRFVFEVKGAGYEALRVVEPDELARFQIISRGGAGADGHSGSDGQAGLDGAECGDGSDGSDGSDGGPGGDGGRGGDIAVAVACVDQPCAEASLQRLRTVIRSLGGAGGVGGTGGTGGRGGSAGASRAPRTHLDQNGNTVVDDSGCSSGSAGRSGRDGARGADGREGEPGSVQFREGGAAQPL